MKKIITKKNKMWRDLWATFWNTYYRTRMSEREEVFNYFKITFLSEEIQSNKHHSYFIEFPTYTK